LVDINKLKMCVVTYHMSPPKTKIIFQSRNKKTYFNLVHISTDSFTYAKIWKHWFQTT